MSTVEVFIASDALPPLACRALAGIERVGVAASFLLEVFAPVPISVPSVLLKACVLAIDSLEGRRIIHGVVMAVTAVGTAQPAPGRVYRLTVRSPFAVLDVGQRCRVYQHLTVPAIVEAVLLAAGGSANGFEARALSDHRKRDYVVQYLESDAAFIRRLCEEDGLFFRFSHKDGVERFVLEDDSTQATGALEHTVVVVDTTGFTFREGLVAFGCEQAHRRRAGKVTLRDYDPERPKLVLEGVHEQGADIERSVEVYAAPGRFADPADGKRRAREHLEALRADAHLIRFRTNARRLAPGRAFTLEIAGDYAGTARPEGKHFVVGLRHAWRFEGDTYDLEVEAVPIEVRYRLPQVTPRPRIAGAQTAIVTGAPGQEIHPEADGRIHVRFHWDREGPKDDKSSAPIRVAQPNMPGSMLIPRVGWEVLVAFEDGDPDRPYVLGRLYNAKQPPPFSLPKNKTLSCIGTNSSPGGARTNLISFDDAAGREHLVIQAATDKTTTVANDLFTQTAKVETCHVGGAQERAVGGSESVSIKQAYFVSVGSQSASVGGTQKIHVKGNLTVGVGAESVLIGGLLAEKVGNPATGAANLAKAAALSGAGALGRAGALFAQAIPIVQGAVQGAQQGGAAGAAKGAIRGVLGLAAGFVPGGEAAMASVTSASAPLPWEEPQLPPGDVAAGGGAGAAMSDASGAQGPGPGHRNTLIKGGMTEVIGGPHAIVTPGPITWQTTGASTFFVAGSHTTKAAAASVRVLGGSVETLGSLRVKSAGILSRDVKGALSTTIGGGLKSSSGGAQVISAKGTLSLKVGGSLVLDGADVSFICGGSIVSASPGGVLIKAGTIKITGASKQSDKSTHQ